jgi:uncharacterized repeat protein (TIGR01451 family)
MTLAGLGVLFPLVAIVGVGLVPLGVLGAPPAAAAGPDFTVAKTASPTSLGLGGGTVTYTYTVTNTGTETLYYRSGSDDKCPNVGYVSGGHQELFGDLYVLSGEAITFRCSQTVTQDTTNVASFTFATRTCFLFCSYGSPITHTATASVTVQQPTYSCDTIWYGSLATGTATGSVGFVLPTQKRVAGISPSAYANTSALAINPLAPEYVYYSPRQTGNTWAGQLWRMPVGGGTGSNVNAPASSAWTTNRLAFASDGTLWSFANNGHLYSWVPGSGTVVDHGIPLSPSNTSTTINFAALASGDITFDGLGNLWVLAADSATATTYLITISDSELNKTSGIGTKLVGVMNQPTSGGFYNGIAFDMRGNLLASASTGNNIYKVDTNTGQATVASTYPTSFGLIGDLASCALPKPELRVNKTANPTGYVNAGDVLTYTITVDNIGNLSATGVTLQDSIPANTAYISGSTTLNGASVSDVNGAMPYATERQINGTGTTFAGVVPQGSTATVTFQVRVDDPLPATVTEIANQGTVRYVGGPTGGVRTDDPTVAGSADPTKSPIANPRIVVTKALGTARVRPGDQFTVAIRTGSGTGPVVSSTSSSTTTGTGSTVDSGTGTTGTFVGRTGTEYFVTESGSGSTNLSLYNATLTCTDSTGRTTGLPSNAVYTGSNSITPAVGANVSCTITNGGKAPTIKLTKALSGSRVKDSDQFTVGIRTGSAAGPVVNNTANSTTTGTGATVTGGTGTTGTYGATSGATYYLTEAAAGSTVLNQYAKSIACVDANGVQSGLPSGVNFSGTLQVTPVLGAAITCTLTNTAVHIDVYVKKIGPDATGTWTALDGSSWQLQADNGGAPGAVLTSPQVAAVAGQTGLFRMTGLVPDTYWLTETTAPSGYSLLAEPIQLTLAPGGAVTVGSGGGSGVVTVGQTAGGDPQLTLRDFRALVLPLTGGTGSAQYVAAGLGLLALAGLTLLALWARAARGRRRVHAGSGVRRIRRVRGGAK